MQPGACRSWPTGAASSTRLPHGALGLFGEVPDQCHGRRDQCRKDQCCGSKDGVFQHKKAFA